jgi:predicted DNA-binding transcriptional regulator YafY
MSIEKYIGRRVEVIYQDSRGQITQRIVTVHSIVDGRAQVYDASKRAYRTLAVDRILAAVPISGRRVS